MPSESTAADPQRSATASDPSDASEVLLVFGMSGEEIRDLQGRLVALGHDIEAGELGDFGMSTETGVRTFQSTRGLVVDGRCDRHTWAALVEAGFRLGDRLLYLRRPMQRGDDVAALQQSLGSLGFDAGRVDGILGPDTEGALKEFQRNTGLTVDGVCGPDVCAALRRLGSRSETTPVAGVRERERLRVASRDLQERRIVIGTGGGLDALANAVARLLHEDGARAAVLEHPDSSRQASQANTFDAEIFVGLEVGEAPCWAAYYATTGFESVGGHQIAELLCAELPLAQLETLPARGMRLPVLRETRMPAVLLHLGPAEDVVTRSSTLAAAIATAVRTWVRTPPES